MTKRSLGAGASATCQLLQKVRQGFCLQTSLRCMLLQQEGGQALLKSVLKSAEGQWGDVEEPRREVK